MSIGLSYGDDKMMFGLDGCFPWMSSERWAFMVFPVVVCNGVSI